MYKCEECGKEVELIAYELSGVFCSAKCQIKNTYRKELEQINNKKGVNDGIRKT
jgi:endogenous inhibitor of DNA gyrase (YacG/DUF329 family)